MQWVTILGSTGSIGKQTLSIIDTCRKSFAIYALSAFDDDEQLWQQCQHYQPQIAVLQDPDAAERLRSRVLKEQLPITILCGPEALVEIARAHEVSIVVVGIVGIAALAPTMAAITSDKRILLANKEVLVAAGAIFMQALQQSNATLFPLDSEHHALFECFHGEIPLTANTLAQIQQVTLTASGGPFRDFLPAQLQTVTVEQACAHPNWRMGKKISVDSATLMNKGFEVIEAYYLFNLPLANIRVVIHPQSQVHAYVHYTDGSCLMQLAHPDMRLSISRGLLWPERLPLSLPQLTVEQLNGLRFYEVDPDKYPCFALAQRALQQQGSAATILNAANEIAVYAFLNQEIRYTDIFYVVNTILTRATITPITDLNLVYACDRATREMTRKLITNEFLVDKNTEKEKA